VLAKMGVPMKTDPYLSKSNSQQVEELNRSLETTEILGGNGGEGGDEILLIL
jgi:hypothetical protein